MTDLVEVRLSAKEWQYLQGSGFLAPVLQRIVTAAEPVSQGAYLLRIPHQSIEEFGDALTERLAKTGFNEAYELTDDGRLLEELIDRFRIQ